MREENLDTKDGCSQTMSSADVGTVAMNRSHLVTTITALRNIDNTARFVQLHC